MDQDEDEDGDECVGESDGKTEVHCNNGKDETNT